VEGSYEHGNESSGSIKEGQFLELTRNYLLLKMSSLHGVQRSDFALF
jgi:hypothetical protein